jgi:glycosyltransferase involved in cell wall biosynthesis
MRDLSVVIPARNEMFLNNTIDSILNNIEADTEVIAICDGSWPVDPIPVNPRVTVVYHPESIGQRAATNEGSKLSLAKYFMKCDAHCDFDKGFDRKLMEDCEYDWTVIPAMYNLHAFDWVCKSCGERRYQGPTPEKCDKCEGTELYRDIVWKPRRGRKTEYWRFDRDLHFQYWGAYKERPEAKGDIVDVMSSIGACFFMHRQRFLDIGGMDEAHGSWGQFGTELACKSWLSGGRHVVNKKTWFGHMFRTQGGDFGFPYPLKGSAVSKAREYSKKLWLGDSWPQAKYPLSWLVNKFNPPDWDENIIKKGMVFYTDNRLDKEIQYAVWNNLNKIKNGHDLVSVSLQPIDFGRNVVLPLQRGYLTMFKQILKGIQECDADVIYLCEHDMLYHPSHFDFIPPTKDKVYYDNNCWQLRSEDGQALFHYTNQTSMLVSYKDVLLEHYTKRVALVEKEGYNRSIGFEPGTRHKVDNLGHDVFMAQYPSIGIRHDKNLTQNRFSQDLFRNKKYCEGWTLADEIPSWGITKNRFKEFIRGVAE